MSDAHDLLTLDDKAAEKLIRSSSGDELMRLLGDLVDNASLDQLFGALQRFVKAASDKQLQELADEPTLRARILDEIFTRMVGQFRTDKAEGLDAVIHWKIFDRPGGGYDHYELLVEDGVARLAEQPSQDPRVTLRIKPVDFLKLVTGNAGATKLALRGKLQVIGDIGFARKVNGLFALPDS